MVIVHWVLRLAPIGVFALAAVAGARAGLAAAGALIHYVAIVVTACVTVTLLVYPLVAATSRVGFGRFAKAVAPAQAFAFSTQSSIASLPAMIEATSGPLSVEERVRNMVLPMAVSIFRITSAAANFAVALYVAALHGIEIGPGLFLVGMLVATVVSLAAVGLPSQVSFFTTIGPVCLAMGVPVELLPLLLAVETIPDIFRTVGNVTADIALTLIVDRRDREA
jgi:Na+/H+-dicarboxylate symporter